MTKFDNKFVPSAPTTYTVSELRDTQQAVKKSSLSTAARSKVVNRSGSNYQNWQATRDIWIPHLYGPVEEWAQLIIPCPAMDCPAMDRNEVSHWIHRRSQCRSSYSQYLHWSTEARVKCIYCENPSHIMNWQFKCHNHCEYHAMDGMKFTRAVVSAINYGSINSDFSTKLLKWFERNPF